MKKILFLLFELTTNVLGNELGNEQNGSRDYLESQRSSIIARINPLIDRLVGTLNQSVFPADFRENSLLVYTQAISDIIAEIVLDPVVLDPNQQERRPELFGFVRGVMDEVTSIMVHISSRIEGAPQNLFVTCIRHGWFEVAEWIFLHTLRKQGALCCEPAIQEANSFIDKYKDICAWTNTAHYQQVCDDLQKIIALVSLLQTMMGVSPVNFICLQKTQQNLVVLEQSLSSVSNLQLLISRIETEPNEADLDSIKTDIDRELPKIKMSLDLIHRVFNSVILSKGGKDLSLIDLCIEKKFFSTILWAVGKGVPVRADQLGKMLDVTVNYSKDPTSYLCEQEDLFSLLGYILKAAKQNMFSASDKEALLQLKSKIDNEITEPQRRTADLLKEEDSCWSELLFLIEKKLETEKKLENLWDPTILWIHLSCLKRHAESSYKMLQEIQDSLNEEASRLLIQQYDLVNKAIRLLSLNPSDEVVLKTIHDIETSLNQKCFPDIEQKKSMMENASPEDMPPHQRYAEVFRIVSSGDCSKAELERCKRIIALLSSEEINNIELWRGISLVVRIASLMCEGASDLFQIIFSKAGIDVSSLIENHNGDIIVSQKHIHDVNIEKQIRAYYLGKAS